MKKLVKILPLVLLIVACGGSEKEIQYESFGDEITDKEVASLAVLNESLDSQDSVLIKLTGKVDEVCQMKGCWMILENGDSDPVRVTFKDYGFFVPKDIAGREVIISGVASKSVLSPETAQHYAEDSGKEYDSTKTYTEIAFVADGVLLTPVQE